MYFSVFIYYFSFLMFDLDTLLIICGKDTFFFINQGIIKNNFTFEGNLLINSGNIGETSTIMNLIVYKSLINTSNFFGKE
ncbi:MAG: hypothetical protein J6P73_00215, partial [Bacteroidales bacterium]|nr:hypothetical protein [Bacteroidales bacterium]